jgi:uncharacterized protein (TIGR02391 family)
MELVGRYRDTKVLKELIGIDCIRGLNVPLEKESYTPCIGAFVLAGDEGCLRLIKLGMALAAKALQGLFYKATNEPNRGFKFSFGEVLIEAQENDAAVSERTLQLGLFFACEILGGHGVNDENTNVIDVYVSQSIVDIHDFERWAKEQIEGCRARNNNRLEPTIPGVSSTAQSPYDAMGKAGGPDFTVLIPDLTSERLSLHPRILKVSKKLFEDDHPWDAVYAAAKALVIYVKERSGCNDRDGADLVRFVFSRKDPILAFNNLVTPTEQDEQEGMMHLFEGAVLGIRNPGSHSFPAGPRERAIEYIILLSLLAYRVQEARKEE